MRLNIFQYNINVAKYIMKAYIKYLHKLQATTVCVMWRLNMLAIQPTRDFSTKTMRQCTSIKTWAKNKLSDAKAGASIWAELQLGILLAS